MCGIAGVIDFFDLPDLALLRRMGVSLRKRGPDDEGAYCRGGIGLLHQRLSIIDLEGGKQPIFNEDGSLALVCNGEVYGFEKLRKELEGRGHWFCTGSDSEVILHLYEELGEGCLHRLNGMFAFAIVNVVTGELFLARDRFGQKPLFYAMDGRGRIGFASGVAALRELAWVDCSLDLQAIHNYLEFLAIPATSSIYRGVHKLQAGGRLLWSRDGGGSLQRWWQPEIRADFAGNYEEACDELRFRLRGAVQRRLLSDVPLGCFLSGGLDSSLITALMQELVPQERVATFSIGFAEKIFDERKYSQQVAEYLHTEHNFLQVEAGSFADFERLVADFEEPFADSSMLPTALLAKFARKKITVALSGDGADELFGGYYRYRLMSVMMASRYLPQALRKFFVKTALAILPSAGSERSGLGKLQRIIRLAGVDGLLRYRMLMSRFSENERRQLYSNKMLDAVRSYDGLAVLQEEYNSSMDGMKVDKIMELDCRRYLVDDILVKVDRASMANALEVRSPFLDVDVAEFAFSLPYKFKQKGKRRKMILQDSFANMLPKEIFVRSKMGFGLPVADWLRGSWRCEMERLLLEGRLVAEGLFVRSRLEDYIKRHLSGQADCSYGLFALMVLAQWLEKRS